VAFLARKRLQVCLEVIIVDTDGTPETVFVSVLDHLLRDESAMSRKSLTSLDFYGRLSSPLGRAYPGTPAECTPEHPVEDWGTDHRVPPMLIGKIDLCGYIHNINDDTDGECDSWGQKAPYILLACRLPETLRLFNRMRS
jgi:hypothetical protein